MKQILLLISIILLSSGCSKSSEPNNPETKITNANTSSSNNYSKEQLKTMKASDFDAQITIEVMDGKLKGTHVFKVNPEETNQMLQITVKKGPGYKQDVTKNGTLMAFSIEQENSNYTLKNLGKEFVGMIKEGSYPARQLKKGVLPRLTIANKNSENQWAKAEGRIKTLNDITFTEVGKWLLIRGKKEVRIVKGSFTDQVEFKYYDSKSLINSETVNVKVTFSTVQRYNPMFSNVE